MDAPTAKATARLMTAEEFAALPDDGYRYALIRGRLLRMSPPGFRRSLIANRIGRFLGDFVEEKGLGVVGVEGGFRLGRDPDRVVGPDVWFVQAARVPPADEQDGFAEMAPDLAVEIVSPSDTASNVQDKVLEYLEAGTPVVWVVEPRLRTVTVYAPDRTARLLIEGETLDGGDVLPGFQVPVAELFR